MNLKQLRLAVKNQRPRENRGQRRRESENVRAIAGTGVDFISVGALTHSARAVDIGDFQTWILRIKTR
jgi:nicotinate-nucleotide pyrophosphorylase (carboxylating)